MTSSARLFRSALCAGLVFASTLASAATPTALFQSSTITSAGPRIAASRVPVVDGTGKVTYKNVELNFSVDTAGNLSLAGSPIITNAPNLITSGFVAGNYKDTSGNKYTLTGPTNIPGSTRTVWSLSFVAGQDAVQFSMNWTTGPIAGHPNEPLIKARSITYTGYTWGTVAQTEVTSANFPFVYWYSNTVVGAVQNGNDIVFHLFSNDNNVEDDSAVLTRCAAAC